MLEDVIKEMNIEYTEEYKVEIDGRVDYYLSRGQMITPGEMNKTGCLK